MDKRSLRGVKTCLRLALVLLLAGFCLFGGRVYSQVPARGPQPLPNPLTLEFALSLADDAHPDLALAEAEHEAAQAELLQAEAESGLQVYVDLTPQQVDPSADSGNEFVNDSVARFSLSKPLYDFGRSSSLQRAAKARIASQALSFLDIRQRRRLQIMKRFFDVLLADLRYAVDNENMAYTYVNFDKARERHKLGQVSDVELLKLESKYQDALIKRTQSQMQQSSTRAQLAIALNRPDELPGDLVRPQFTVAKRDIPEHQTLWAQVMKNNPRLQALRRGLEAAEESLQAERARRRPSLTAELEATEYQREIGLRDAARATLNLHIPLYQGKRDSAAIAQAAALKRRRQAQLQKAELELRQTVFDLLQELEELKIQYHAAQVRLDYQDLNLDRRRALYEMEVQTTLGEAMIGVTDAQWRLAGVEFAQMLAWARLEALQGQLIAGAAPRPGQ